MNNKLVLITGVSKGIGNATARKLVAEGYQILGTYNQHQAEAEALAEELGIEVQQVDFADRTSTINWLAGLTDRNFYAIINNAGVIEFEGWDEFKMDTWDKLMEINLNAPLLICHTLRNNIQESGVIVNVASVDGLTGAIASVAYSASKAALINLSQSLANVFSTKKVRVNSIAPGWIGDGMGSPALADAKWMNPLGRTANYEEIANAIKFLLSGDASFVNGSNMVVDGGSGAVDYVLKKEAELTAS